MRFLPALVLLLLPALALAQAAGPARVIDGDTLEVGGTTQHLYGIDAPEPGQECEHYGALWPCGAEARTVLERTIANRPVTCRERGLSDDGTPLGDCRIGDESVNREMLTTGMAVAVAGAEPILRQDEAAARRAGRGLWAGRFVTPAEWRAGKRLEPTPAAERCRIKGDIGAGGAKRYYVPIHPRYAEVEVDRARGERWFCTEIEAIRAGWELAE